MNQKEPFQTGIHELNISNLTWMLIPKLFPVFVDLSTDQFFKGAFL